MKIILAELYKQFDSSANTEKLLKNETFVLFGHFDFLQFKVLELHDCIKGTALTEVKRDNSYNGFDRQSMYLFDSAENDDSLKYYLSSNYHSREKALPFCVVVIAEDRIEQNASNSGESNPPTHLERYREKYQSFMSKQKSKDQLLEVRAFHTLSCMDAVLVLRTNSLQMAHAFVYDLTASGDVIYTYSLMGAPVHFDYCPYKDEFRETNLELSARLTLKTNADENRILMRINERLCEMPDVTYTLSSLAGSHHYLYQFEGNIYSLIHEITSESGVLNICSQANREVFESCRTTLRFKPEVIGLEFKETDQKKGTKGLEKNAETETEVSKNEKTEEEPGILHTLLKDLCTLTANCYNLIDKSHEVKVQLERADQYAKSLINHVAQNLQFFQLLACQGRQQINPELFHAIERLLIALDNQINGFYEILQTRIEEKISYSTAIIVYERFLNQLQICVDNTSKHMHELARMQRNMVEDKGVYQNEVSAIAKLSLGYLQYAQELSDALYGTQQKRDPTLKGGNPFAFLVTFDTMQEKVSVTEQFHYVNDFDQRHRRPESSSIIHIRIAQQYAFCIQEILAAITHEVAHHVGFRNREVRVECVIKSVCRWFAGMAVRKNPYELSARYENDQNNELVQVLREFKTECAEDIDTEVKKVRKELEDLLFGFVIKNIRERYDQKLQWCYQARLRDELIYQFDQIISGPVVKQNSLVAELDIPSYIVNANISLQNEITAMLIEWVSKERKSTSNSARFDIVMDIAHSKDEMLEMEMVNAQILFNQLRYGMATESSFMDYQVNDHGLLKLRTGLPLKNNPKHERRTTLFSVIDDICQVYSETYCDMLTIKLLNLSAEQYYNHVWLTRNTACKDSWRIWVVLKAAFESDKRLSNEQMQQIQQDAKGYAEQFDDWIVQYLQKTFEVEELKTLCNRDNELFAAVHKRDAFANADDQFEYLYRLYENLHHSGNTSLYGKTSLQKG